MGWFGKAKQMVQESDAFQQAAQSAGVDISTMQHERIATAEDAEFDALRRFAEELSAKLGGLAARSAEVPRLGRQAAAAYHELRLSVASTMQTDMGLGQLSHAGGGGDGAGGGAGGGAGSSVMLGVAPGSDAVGYSARLAGYTTADSGVRWHDGQRASRRCRRPCCRRWRSGRAPA